MMHIPLWQQIIIGLLLGIITGLWLGPEAELLKPLGDIFLKLIKLIIVPLVFFALLSAITSMHRSGNLVRISLKTVSLFLLTSLLAVIIGIVAALLFQPGVGVNLHLPETDILIETTPSILDILLSIIPENATSALTEGHILQLIVLAIFSGITLNLIASKVPYTLKFINELANLFFKMIELIVKLSPIAVFAYISWIIGTQGTDIIIALTRFVAIVAGACILQYLIFGLFIFLFAHVSPLPFYRKMIEPQLLAFSTSSSKAALSTTMRTLHEKMGISEENTNFILPLGASINMDGTAIYLAVCGIFFAEIYGISLDWHHYLMLAFSSTLASIGAAGIPSGSIIFMGMVLNSIGLPLEGISLIIGVDRILDMLRTTINITGDSAITLIIDKSEGKIDIQQYYKK